MRAEPKPPQRHVYLIAFAFLPLLAAGGCGEEPAGTSRISNTETAVPSAADPDSAERVGAKAKAGGEAGNDESEASPGQDKAPLMRWSFRETSQRPVLTYGEPQTDHVRLMLRCAGSDISLHFMRSAEVVSQRPDHLEVASGELSWTTRVTAEESQLGGMSLTATTPSDSGPMTAFRSGRSLRVRWGGEAIELPGTPLAPRFLDSCRPREEAA